MLHETPWVFHGFPKKHYFINFHWIIKKSPMGRIFFANIIFKITALNRFRDLWHHVNDSQILNKSGSSRTPVGNFVCYRLFRKSSSQIENGFITGRFSVMKCYPISAKRYKYIPNAWPFWEKWKQSCVIYEISRTSSNLWSGSSGALKDLMKGWITTVKSSLLSYLPLLIWKWMKATHYPLNNFKFLKITSSSSAFWYALVSRVITSISFPPLWKHSQNNRWRTLHIGVLFILKLTETSEINKFWIKQWRYKLTIIISKILISKAKSKWISNTNDSSYITFLKLVL